MNLAGFGVSSTPLGSKEAGMRRAGTLIRSPIERRQRDKDKQQTDGELRASEVCISDVLEDAVNFSLARFLGSSSSKLQNSYIRKTISSRISCKSTTPGLRLPIIWGWITTSVDKQLVQPF